VPKQAAKRVQITVTPLSPEERQRIDDIDWAHEDPDVRSRYSGQFVVPYNHQIVAHGTSYTDVLQEAANKTGRKPEELPVVGIEDFFAEIPLDEFP
jgi:hypothetical protein